MKEIKIVPNREHSTFRDKQFFVYVDGELIENVAEIEIKAKEVSFDMSRSNSDYVDIDSIISYKIGYKVPWEFDNI